jgi:atypical dual specificity phosphatase
MEPCLQVSSILDDCLYLGAYYTARDENVMRALGITHVVNVSAIELENSFESTTHYSPKYLDIYLHDLADENISIHFQDAHHFIKEALSTPGNKVLVHCRLGVSRSATIVISYLMQFNDMGLKTAFQFVCQRRPIIFPNFGFWDQLVRYECELQGTDSQSSFSLVDYVLHMTNAIRLEDHTKEVEKTESMRKVVREVLSRHTNLRKFTYEVHAALNFRRPE